MNAQQKSLDFLGIQAKILGLQRYLVMRLRESRFHLYVMKFAIIRRIANHHAKFYLQCWAEYNEEAKEGTSVVVPQDHLNLTTATLGGHLFWKDLEECQGWRLQQNLMTGHCRILNPENQRLAWGKETIMRQAFQKVKCQLTRRK